MVTLFVSPVFHALTWLVTLHAPEEPVLDGDADGEAEAEADGEALAEAEADALGDGLPVPLPSRPKKWTATAAMPVCGKACPTPAML
jgi:hypothetical protein